MTEPTEAPPHETPTPPPTEPPVEVPSDCLSVEVDVDPHVGYALQVNGVPLVKALRIMNLGDAPVGGLRVAVFAEPDLSPRLELPVGGIAAHGSWRFDALGLPISSARLAERTEAEEGTLWIEVTEGNEVLLRSATPLEVLAADEWPGTDSLPEILAAFVLPEHPATRERLATGARHLETATGDAALDGYDRRDPTRVRAVCAAIHAAIADLEVTLEDEPEARSTAARRIRPPDQIAASKTATRLDLALWFAGLFEGAGLHPLIVQLDTGPFVGVWLEDESFIDPAIDELMRLQKRLELESIVLFDPASAASGSTTSFEDSVRETAQGIADARVEQLLQAIDVETARRAHVAPLPFGVTRSVEPVAPEPLEKEPPALEPPAPLTRVERWKRRLLDLSLRNRLLNHRTTSKTIPLAVHDLARLEDLLADGRVFRLLPERPADSEDDESALRQRELESGRLRTTLADEDLERRLVRVYRAARLSLQEGGANTLYLAVGFLRWYETPASPTERRAPILLYPLVMTRRSVAEGTKGYRIELADDEPQVNITLLQKLEGEFEIRVPGLDELDTDENGLDLSRILDRFRQAIRPMQRWKVEEDAAVGLFSFTKYLMWLDLDRRERALTRNAVVRHLFETPDQPFAEDVEFPDPSTFDANRPATDVFVPAPADSSQQTAIFAAADGHTFVLEGPPGTGKSQTITNLISHALATGKRVLFVSEKIAALDVVHKRLSRTGLAPFCLELHSNKARKRGVLEQLRQALDIAGRKAPETWPRVAEQLDTVRTEVNAHTKALHEKRSFGRSAFHGLSRLIALRDAPRVRLSFGEHDAVDVDALERKRSVVRDAKVALQTVGDPREHPWRASRLEEWGPALPARAEETGSRVADAASLLEDASTALAADLEVEPQDLSRRDLDALAEAAALFARTPAPPVRLLTEGAFEQERERIEAWIATGRVVKGHAEALGARWEDALLDLDLPALRKQIEASGKTFWPFSWLEARTAKKQMKTVLRTDGLPATDALLADLEPAIDWRQRRQELDAADAEAKELLGAHWRGCMTNWDRLAGMLDWTARVRNLTARLGEHAIGDAESLGARFVVLARDGREVFATDAPAGRRRSAFEEAAAALLTIQEEAEAAFELDVEIARGTGDEASYAARVRSTALAWRDHKARLRDWCAFVRARVAMDEVGLEPLREALERREITPEHMEDAFEHSFQAWWIEALFEAVPVLRRFRGPEQEARIDEFRRLDGEVMDTTKEVVLARLGGDLPSGRAAAAFRSDSSEMGLLHRELMKRRNMPIRRLFERIPNVLIRLKPCMLMSPLSVAQYLGPDFPSFDLVVFDEASQIPPWDAIGAIARGEKLVVVGDSRQLPPTNFFQRSQEGEELDDEDDLREMESILDECIAARLPRLHLGWHYRSRHESLIAFSNHRYYKDGLYTFPSAIHESPRLGVSWRHVPDGVYDKGRSRTNRIEAEALVQEIVRRLTDPEESKRSLGVVTFSIAQASLVEDLLEQARRDHPEIEPHFDDAREEPVFVKNLENVQGDERDVILLSVCYGPDAEGRVALNFGPLNREGGERRLNVAITRSREQVVVFSTLRSEQIDLARTQARGARDLKAFLEYAEIGADALGQALRLPDEVKTEFAFETSVAEALQAAGWSVKTHVGCSGYRVDLGIEDPDEPGRFLTAVGSDGVTYGKAATARDRHGTRPFVLRRLGWNHVRIWSTDWWQDPAGELRKLVGDLETAREARTRAREEETRPETRSAPEKAPDPGPAQEDEAPGPKAEADVPLGILLGGTAYERTDVDRGIGDPRSFYDTKKNAMIVRRIEKVIDTEAPVALGVIARRLADAWGLKNITTRLKDRVGSLITRAGNWRFSATSTDFFWKRDQDPTRYEGFRVPAKGARSVRRPRHIPREEIANAAGRLLSEHVSIEVEDLARETARVFGFRRITDKVRAPMEEGVRLLAERGGGVLEEGRIRLP